MNGTIGSNFQYQLFIVGLLFNTEVFYLIFYITYRCVNRINGNYIYIGTVFTVFIGRNVTSTFVNSNIHL